MTRGEPGTAPIAADAGAGGGILLLTFDDYFVPEWSAAREIFTRYGARVTFFISEPYKLGADDWRGLRELADDGHTVGAHGYRHLWAPDRIAALGGDGYLREDVDPCLDALRGHGFEPRCFAYPVSRRDGASDEVLGRIFTRLRGGARIDPGTDLASADAIFVPAAEAAGRRVLLGAGVDTGKEFRPAGVSDASVRSALVRAAERAEAVTFYAHAIADRHQANHTAPGRVEAILAQASELGLGSLGFDDLDG
ncbi:polysaccharide deacetylase family protein [Streptosporangium amethystogenes]|uniref:polysaccharide deacetylase family protein n=1 Tax=Streptosporangium amethystogenes TaxID=2002 RepID=UPI0004CBCC92|nr:polysaccharide deacetylase family protein [Streptosporangium amethystogenes]